MFTKQAAEYVKAMKEQDLLLDDPEGAAAEAFEHGMGHLWNILYCKYAEIFNRDNVSEMFW